MTSSGLRWPRAISIAESTNSVRRCVAIAHAQKFLRYDRPTERIYDHRQVQKPEAVGT